MTSKVTIVKSDEKFRLDSRLQTHTFAFLHDVHNSLRGNCHEAVHTSSIHQHQQHQHQHQHQIIHSQMTDCKTKDFKQHFILLELTTFFEDQMEWKI